MRRTRRRFHRGTATVPPGELCCSSGGLNAARVAADGGEAAQHERGGLRRREPDELEEHSQPHAARRHARLQGHSGHY